MNFQPHPAARISACLALLLLAQPAVAGSFTFGGTSSTSNQSMWSGGPSFVFDLNGARFVTPTVSSASDVGVGIDCRFLGVCFGYDATIAGSARLGVVFDFTASAGTVTAAIPVSTLLTAPETALPGSTFRITNTGLTFGKGTLSTSGPGIFAGAGLDLQLSAGFYGTACSGGCTDFGSEKNLLDLDTGLETFILFTLNSNNNGKFQIANGTFSYDVGRTFQVADFLSATINLPKGPDTTGTGSGKITSSGTSSLVNVDFNVTNLLAELGRLPPPKGSLSVCCGLSVDYNLFSVNSLMSFAMSQDFTLLPQASLYFNVTQTGERILAGTETSLLFPAGVSRLDIVPEIVVGGNLTNMTGLCLQPTFTVTGLAGSLNVADSPVQSFGPLFNRSFSPGCFGTDAYKKSFDLGGFNVIRGDPFTVLAANSGGTDGGGAGSGSGPDTAPVPEPSAFLLTGGALVLLGLARTLLERVHSGTLCYPPDEEVPSCPQPDMIPTDSRATVVDSNSCPFSCSPSTAFTTTSPIRKRFR